jgi:hypothetical protein
MEWFLGEHYRLNTFPTKAVFLASFSLIILRKILIKEKCIKMKKICLIHQHVSHEQIFSSTYI